MRGPTTVCLPILAFGLACSSGAPDHRAEIRGALQRLLTRSNSDAFLILEDAASRRFVQFGGSASQPLLLDLPSQTLAPAELERARALFADLGVALEQWETTDGPGGEVVGTQSGFQLELGRDAERATDLALRVFAEVYQLPVDFPLALSEN